MTLNEAYRLIGEAVGEILKVEIRNIYGSIGSETPMQLHVRLATGFDRLISFEAMAKSLAEAKFGG